MDAIFEKYKQKTQNKQPKQFSVLIYTDWQIQIGWSIECHKNLLMSQHWFKHGAIQLHCLKCGDG